MSHRTALFCDNLLTVFCLGAHGGAHGGVLGGWPWPQAGRAHPRSCPRGGSEDEGLRGPGAAPTWRPCLSQRPGHLLPSPSVWRTGSCLRLRFPGQHFILPSFSEEEKQSTYLSHQWPQGMIASFRRFPHQCHHLW